MNADERRRRAGFAGLFAVDTDRRADPALPLSGRQSRPYDYDCYPGGQPNRRPASMWKWRCMTSWPASGPLLVTTRYPPVRPI